MPRETICVGNERVAEGKWIGAAKSARAFPLRDVIAAMLLAFVAVGPVRAMDWLAERRQQIEQMTPAEKEELNDKYEKFLALSPEQQEQLRVLHQKLDTDPNGERLRRVMQRYYDWLKTLSPGERADLLSLPTADRVAKIKTLKQDQEAWAAKLSGGSHLTLHDVQVLSDWVKKYAVAHEAELLKDMPSRGHGHFAPIGDDPDGQKKMVQFSAWRHLSGSKLPDLSQEDVDQLTHDVSADPRKAIEAQQTLHDKTEIIHQWLQAIGRTRFAGGGGFGRQGPNVSRKDLAHFFTHDLSKEKQDELLRISDKDEQHRELRKLYFQHRRSTESSTGAGGDTDKHANKTAPKAPDEKQPPAEKQQPSPPDAAAKSPDAPKT